MFQRRDWTNGCGVRRRSLAATAAMFTSGIFFCATASAAPVIVSVTFDDGILDTATDDNPTTPLDDIYELARATLTDEDTTANETLCPNVGAVGDPPQLGENLDCDLGATYYVNFPRLDEDKFLTTANVQAMDSWGHEIAGHSAHHLDIPKLESASATTLDLDEQRLQMCWDRRRLSLIPKLNGSGTFNIYSFAYPFGSFQWAGDPVNVSRFGAPTPALDPDQTRQIVGRTNPGECAYRSARTVGTAVNTPFCVDRDPTTPCAWAELKKPPDPFALRAPSSIEQETPLDYPVIPPNDDGNGIYDRPEEFEARAGSVKGWIDNAIAHAPASGQNWIILTFHSVCFNHECNKYGPEYHDFKALMTWLRQKRKAGEIVVQTVHEVLNQNTELSVTVPQLPAPRVVVQNGYLTADINRDYNPDCYQISGSGVVDEETATPINTAHADADDDLNGIADDGHNGDRWYGWLVLSSGVTRARYLTRLDAGHCAPTVKAGNQYKINLYYRTPSGPRQCPFNDLPASLPCPIPPGPSVSGVPPQFFMIYAFRRPMGSRTDIPDQDGFWGGFTQIPLADPTPEWQLAEGVVTAAASSNGLSFGFEIRHNDASGDVQVDVDDFSYCLVTNDPTDPVPLCPP